MVACNRTIVLTSTQVFLFSVGFLEAGSENDHLMPGTKMELPFWMAKALCSRKRKTVSTGTKGAVIINWGGGGINILSKNFAADAAGLYLLLPTNCLSN